MKDADSSEMTMLKTSSGSGRRVFKAESVTVISDILTRKTTSNMDEIPAPPGACRLVRSRGLPGASRVPPASRRANMLTWRATSPRKRPTVVGVSWTRVGAREFRNMRTTPAHVRRGSVTFVRTLPVLRAAEQATILTFSGK